MPSTQPLNCPRDGAPLRCVATIQDAPKKDVPRTTTQSVTLWHCSRCNGDWRYDSSASRMLPWPMPTRAVSSY